MASVPPHRGEVPEWAGTNCQAVLEAAPDAMLMVNRAGEVLAANLQAEKLYGFSHEQLIGKVVESLLPARFRERHRQHREHFLADPETQFMQVPGIFGLRSDSSEFPVDVSLSRLTIGSETFAISAIRDTTERLRMEELKRSEAVLRESEEHFRLLADTAPVLIWQSGKDKLCTYFNKPWLDFTGRSMEEELGNGWAEGVHAGDLQKCLDTYTQSFERREKFRMEYRLRHHDGQYRWIVDIGLPRFNQDGSFAGYIGVGVDITERKLAEDQLREYERAVEAAEEMIAVVDREYRILLANRKYATMRNMVKEKILGRFVHEVLNREVFEAVVKPKLDECFEGKVVRYEMKYTYPELGERDMSVSYFPIEGATGVDGATCIFQDITERKRAQEALCKSEEQFRTLAEAIPQLCWMARGDGYVFWYNQRWYTYTGTTPKQVQGWGWQSVHDPRTLPEVLERWKVSVSTGEPFDMVFPLRGADGIFRPFLTRVMPIRDADGRVVRWFGTDTDITELRDAQERLRTSEERLRLAQWAARIGTFDLDIRTGVDIWTPETEALYGLPPGGFGGTLTAFENLIHPDDRERITELTREMMRTGQPGEAEWRAVWPDGSVHWIAGRGLVFMNESGEPLRMAGINIDITERKRAEEALSGMTRKLVEAQEQERARIARELHDDINQRLALLAIELDRVREKRNDLPSEIRGLMQELQQMTADISSRVYALSHELHSLTPDSLGLAKEMRSWCREFGERQKLKIDFKSHDVPTLPQDISLCLFRVLQEALHNAAKHSGVKRIDVQLQEESGEIQLTVSDLGKGFDVSAAVQDGGLGITSMHERVRLVGGTVMIDSKPLAGTTVLVRVPLGADRSFQSAAG